MAFVNVREVRVRADDGVELTAWRSGGGPGPALVLCNGIVGDVDVWRDLIADFGAWHPVVGWEYRGLRGRAADEPIADVARHAADLAAVCAATGIDDAVLVGWSIGSRVALQAVGTAAVQVRALVLIAGLYGRPLRDALAPWVGPVGYAAPWLANVAGEIAPHAPQLWRMAAAGMRSRAIHDVLRLLGVISETMSRARLAEVLSDTARIDLRRLVGNARAFDAHCADVPLADPGVPCLLISGRNDPLSAPDAVADAAQALGEARTMLVPSAGHLLPLEFAELVNLRIERFLRLALGFDRFADRPR